MSGANAPRDGTRLPRLPGSARLVGQSELSVPAAWLGRKITIDTIKVGINGFGRIGRQSLKAILDRHPGKLDVVAINDLADPHTSAHLLAYDTNYGRFPGRITFAGTTLYVNDQ